LRYVPADQDGPPRVAYAIGRAVGGAVARNRVRRRVRGALEQLEPGLAPGTYLFGADARALTMPFPQLVAAIDALVRDAKAAR
jgi:ribonuclease P protein component